MQFGKIGLAMVSLLALTGTAAPCSLTISVEELRSERGMLRMCLTRLEEFFPDCEGDPNAYRVTVPARDGRARITNLSPGQYALAVVHDENANARLDRFAGIPREGIGFSRNPSFSFGPPRFSNTLFDAPSGETSQSVRMRYYL